MIAVTQKQRAFLNFIESFVEEHRYSPSYDEIAKGLGLKAISTVHKHMTNLKNKGIIGQAKNKSGSIDVIDESSKSRFVFEGPHHLWDKVLGCYWVKESDVRK